MKNKGKTQYYDASLLILNTMFFKRFLSTLDSCCDASEINIPVKFF